MRSPQHHVFAEPLRLDQIVESGLCIGCGLCVSIAGGDRVGLEPRCNVCPDAIGLGSDIAASDTWPGGGPTGEDEGFNGIIVRTERGLELYEAAVAAGALTIIRDASFGDFDDFQPHQVRKRRAVWARLKGINAAGRPVPVVRDLEIDECARLNSLRENLAEYRGARDRVKRGRLGEPKPVARGEAAATDS